MNDTLTSNESISAALASAATDVRPEGNECWTLALGEGRFPRITARHVGHWLALETDIPRNADTASPRAESFWDALVHSATLTGLAKFILNLEGQLRLRADLLLHEELDLTSQLRAACAGFQSAWAQTPSATPTAGLGTEIVAATIGSQSNELTSQPYGESNLKQIVAETGWPFSERASGKLAVELEVAHGFYQALLVPVARGVRVLCDLETGEASSAECRQAAAGLLLATSGAVRLVRAVAISGPDVAVARLEVVFEETPSALELTQAFENLSVGCSLCGDEIKLLQDADVAQRYRETRGWI